MNLDFKNVNVSRSYLFVLVCGEGESGGSGSESGQTSVHSTYVQYVEANDPTNIYAAATNGHIP